MVKLIQDALSPEGFPQVRWAQDVPTGESAHSVGARMEWKIAVVIMVFVLFAVYAASEQIWAAVIAAVIVGGMVLRGDQMLKGGITVWDVHIKGPEPSPGAAEAERRARATAMLAEEFREAMVQPHGEMRELYFWVFRGVMGSKMECVGQVPLSSIQGFELGTAEEWFMDIAQAELRRMGSSPNSHVIVATTTGYGVVPVAESGGAKASMAHLHGVLVRRFIIEATEMQERWREKLEEESVRQGKQS